MAVIFRAVNAIQLRTKRDIEKAKAKFPTIAEITPEKDGYEIQMRWPWSFKVPRGYWLVNDPIKNGHINSFSPATFAECFEVVKIPKKMKAQAMSGGD